MDYARSVGGEEVVVGESQVGGEEAIVGKAEVGGEEAVRGEAGVGGEEEVAVEDVMLDEAEVVVEDENDEGSYAKKLDDSEEERVADDDDEFGMDIQERVRNIRSILERWKAMRKNSITVKSKRDVGEGSFMTNADIGGQTQRTPTVSGASSATGPSNQTCNSRKRSTPRVAANVNQGERPPTTQTRSMVAQVIGS
ncbi:hypothetical protein DEO72_LG8g3022 [Vigna unguiculata]|uniref:Uncharacterized protein n=1 Tax=Vigna unguiculata TaxID=3917 RepID=A0A4D6MU15_VIGUN|nr:hypothetical protein DEO72_LG8g3022 [Vigna unguiculata]